MTTPAQELLPGMLPGFVLVPGLTRKQYDELPEDVRRFLTWNDARRERVVTITNVVIDERRTWELLAFFERRHYGSRKVCQEAQE